ncbi:NrdH-redoxin [Candidatus Woesearchaeota archaeon]|nr:NrdH-redoxin [Candidatus Woesearchaeota archaeon]
MTKVNVYSTPTCPWCKKIKDYLKEKDVDFIEHNVAEDTKAREEMVEKSGQLGVPVVDIDGTVIVGFDKDKIDKSLENL